MPRSRVQRWFVRMGWLVVVVLGYRSLVDFGAQGSAGYVLNMLAMLGIYAAGDALLEWLWPAHRGADARPADAADRPPRRS